MKLILVIPIYSAKQPVLWLWTDLSSYQWWWYPSQWNNLPMVMLNNEVGSAFYKWKFEIIKTWSITYKLSTNRIRTLYILYAAVSIHLNTILVQIPLFHQPIPESSSFSDFSRTSFVQKHELINCKRVHNIFVIGLLFARHVLRGSKPR